MKLGTPLNVKWEDTNVKYDVKKEYGRMVGEYHSTRWWFEPKLDESTILSKIIEKFKGNSDVDIKYIYIKFKKTVDVGWGRLKDIYDVDLQFYGKGIAFLTVIALLLITIIVSEITYSLVFAPSKVQKAAKTVLFGAGVGIIILLIILLLLSRRR